MFLRYILLLALSSLLGATAQAGSRSSNITVAFFPASDDSTCKANDITNAISLTTDDVPGTYTCFNLTELFDQRSNYSYQDLWDLNRYPPYPHINYTLNNEESYDPKTNYTRVWFDLGSRGEEDKEGKDSPWVLYTYAFYDCLQVGGDNFPMEDYPWFETSCQSKEGGECREEKAAIKSFALNTAVDYNKGHGHCEVWAKFGGASSLNRQKSLVAAVSVAFAVTVTMFFVL